VKARALAIVVLLAGCATPPVASSRPGSAVAPAAGVASAAGERLIVRPPPGWHLAFTDDKPEVLLEEHVPDGQSVDNWTDMVTVITFRGFTREPLAFFANALAHSAVGGCEKRPSIGRPQEGAQEGGYPVMFQIVACPKTKRWGSAEVFMAKTIKGREATYQVQRAWRMPPRESVQELQLAKEELERASAYLATTYVCDTRVPSTPCPP
jgi:hypothetical protein